MAASGLLPVTPDLPTLRAKLQGLLRFLGDALAIANAHTVDFYTESLWEELVDLAPEAALAALQLRREAGPWDAQPRGHAAPGPGVTNFPKIFSETSQKLVSAEAFALAAKYFSPQNLGICTPFEQLLIALQGKEQQRSGENVKPVDFMNMKKSHEVQAMSELISSIAGYYGIKQVIDLGSGKGYLSSFLSLKYGLKVYGIDSSSTNTHGAKERNRKLKRCWKSHHPQSRLDVNGTTLQTSGGTTEQSEMNYKADIEDVCSIRPANKDKTTTSDCFPAVSDSVISNIRKQMEHLCTQPHLEENCLENDFSLINLFPINETEAASSSKGPSKGKEMPETSHGRRNTTAKSNDSNIYSPLTSFITADSELHSIIEDLEDCLLVGLHTCGDLAPNTLRIFASNSEIKGVCSVGCCYHLLSEEFENQPKECPQEKWGFPMSCYLKGEKWCCGRNARMSACLALERVEVGQGLPTESLFYRAVLQVIIKDCYGITKCEQHVGKIYSKSSSFLDYVRKSLRKLGLDDSKLPEDLIMDYYQKYKPRMNELEAFNMLKVVLAPCIETLILLDRLCYLKEQEDVTWSALVKLFDPVASPRCYAVLALKKQE